MKNFIVARVFLIALTALLTGFAAANVRAQNSISGLVFDPNRRPVADIYVELLDEYERLIRSTKTGGGGLYIFQGLRSGVYFIQARTAGTNFRDAKERVQLGEGNRVGRQNNVTTGAEALQLNLTLQFNTRGRDDTPLTNEVVFAQNVSADAEKYYETALKSFERKNQSEGIAALEKAIEIFPDYYLALDRLGSEYFAQEKFAEAENVFARALAVNPKSFSSAYGLGATRYFLRKQTDAARALETAITINPASVNSYFLLARVQRELKEYEKAEANLKKSNELADGKMPDIHWELALLYYHNLKRFDDAARELELYLKTNPKADNKEQVGRLIKQIREKANQPK